MKNNKSNKGVKIWMLFAIVRMRENNKRHKRPMNNIYIRRYRQIDRSVERQRDIDVK